MGIEILRGVYPERSEWAQDDNGRHNLPFMLQLPQLHQPHLHDEGENMDTALVVAATMLTHTAVGADLSGTPPIHRPPFSHPNTSFLHTSLSSTPEEGKA
jgi:hypothetical protein